MNTRRTLMMFATIAMFAMFANATALTANATVAHRTGDSVSLMVASNQTIYIGALIAADSNGNAVNAADSASSNQVIGVAQQWIDTTGSNYRTNIYVRVLTGDYRLANSSSVFNKSSIGQFASVLDNATVTTAANTTYDIIAGVIVDVDAQGCWVNIGPYNRALAGNITTLNVAGNATVVGSSALGALTTSGTTSLGGVTVAITNNATVAGTLVDSSTVSATGYKIGTYAGYSGVITNIPGATNLFYFSGGIVTNITHTP